MSPIAYIALFGWIPAVMLMFRSWPVRKAATFAFVAGWLFLPVASIKLTGGIPAYSKMSATSYAVLLATILFNSKRLYSLQLSWLDLPVLLWCLCPFASSITNDLGYYDGGSAVFYQTVTWGLPYYLGRIYLTDLAGMRQVAMAIYLGGLAYVPLCLIELRFSPQLHRWVYGYSITQNFALVERFGGYRPTVFMETGLMVGIWMMAATLSGIWLWQSGNLKKPLWGIPANVWVGTLFITTILVKSSGAIVELFVGIFFFGLVKWLRNSFLLIVLILGIVFYVYDGASGNFSGDQIISSFSSINQERADSLEFRFQNEKLLSAKAREQWLFGWGGWGRSRIYDSKGKDISVTDSLWIIIFGTSGAVGLFSFLTSLLLPIVVFIKRYPPSSLLHQNVAPAAAIASIVVLYVIDCLVNAMVNPIYMFAVGGLVGVLIDQRLSKIKKVASKGVTAKYSIGRRYGSAKN